MRWPRTRKSNRDTVITLDEPRPATELREIVLEPDPEPEAEPAPAHEPESVAESPTSDTAAVITPPTPAPETAPRRWHRA